MNECLNKLMCEWMYECVNEWMNVLMCNWMCECLNKWMCEQIYERMYV